MLFFRIPIHVRAAARLLWISRFLKPTQFPIGQTSRNVAVDVILGTRLVFLCATKNTRGHTEKIQKHTDNSTPTKHKQQTQQIRKCIEETQKRPQLWGRLPNQKLQVIWAAAACVWVDTCIVVCCVQCLVDELMPDGIVCDCR